MDLTAFPPPSAFGLPPGFTAWRTHQVQAWQTILDAPTRFVAIVAPTGAGKSLIYMTAAVLTDGRVVILTATKGNQDQLEGGFSETGLLDMRGQDNYGCRAFQEGGDWFALRPDDEKDRSCHHGPCHVGLPCSYKEAGCEYYDRVRAVAGADYVSTNYAWWMATKRYSQDQRYPPSLLVLDEAHLSDAELSNGLQIKIDHWLLKATSKMPGQGVGDWQIAEWKQWAAWTAASIKAVLDNPPGKSPGALKYRKRLQQVERLCRNVMAMGVGDWVDDHTADAFVFECLHPAQYAEGLLFQGASKVVLTSATLTPKTLELLGVDPSEVTWYSMPSTFPVNRRPVVHVPTVRVDTKMTDLHWSAWVDRIDQIIGARPTWKGIVHTVSYARAKRLFQMSKHAHRMILVPPGQTASAVAGFRKYPEPMVLLSPAIMTGWDFPHDQCRFQILAKLPFPDTRSNIVKARQALDKDYGPHLMMQNLVQAVGRGMRDETDWCETFIVDDHWEWVRGKYKAFAPDWFWVAVKKSIVLPPPLVLAA